MKELFVVSNQRELWAGGLKNIFILDPYVHHKMMVDGAAEGYENITIAPSRRRKARDLDEDNKFVNKKYQIYSELFASRLNAIHGLNHDNYFWKKSLSMGFLRYITLVHDAFMNFEQYFNESTHDCRILASSAYHIPKDFEEQRNLLQFSDFGQEQLFSIYINLFHKNIFPSAEVYYKQFDASASNKLGKRIIVDGVLVKLAKKVKKLSLKKLLIRFLYSRRSKNDIQVGLFGAHFAQVFLEELIYKSKGTINVVPNVGLNFKQGNDIDCSMRAELASVEPAFDKFDNYFFKTTESLFPKALLEDYKNLTGEIEAHFSPYKNLRYLVSESWIGSTIYSMALAYMQMKNVRHIYNEHNVLLHPWVGSMVENRADLSDVYLTMGWYESNVPSLIKGASLFDFLPREKKEVKYPATLISSYSPAKIPEYSAAYGFCGEGIPRFAEFMLEFYSTLSLPTKKNILYRGPRPGWEWITTYDDEYLLHPYLSQLLRIDTSQLTGKELMASSGLVIVDYFATTFLEAMLMNVPTVLLLNSDIYYLKKDYSGFFDELIEVGICQTDPAEAAKFIESIISAPQVWWLDKKTQDAKKKFLEKNFGKPQIAVDYYMGLADSGIGK